MKRQWERLSPGWVFDLGKPPPWFALPQNGENHPAKREGGRQREAALGLEDDGPTATGNITIS